MKTPGREFPPHDDEAIEATAAAWLAQRDDGLTSVEEAEFAAWRQADPRHAGAVTRLEETWAALRQLRDFRPEARMHPDRDLLARAHRGRAVPFRMVAGAVGMAAAFTLAALWWHTHEADRPDPAPQTYATTVDGYERLTLADGSLLELNSATEVSVFFSPAERRVRLVRGEAHFTVAKNPARPFLVDAGGVAVRAVGTAFNVRLGAREVEVLVTEGSVQVKRETARGADAAPPGVPSEKAHPAPAAAPWLLAANERARIVTALDGPSASAPVIERVAPAVVREALAWQGARLVFVDTPLGEAIAQFNRHNPVQIILGDAELGALPIGGSFRADNVDAFVRLLASGNGIAVERPDETTVILRRAK